MKKSDLTNQNIEKQRKEVFELKPTVKLVAPCKINNGIIKLSQVQQEESKQLFERSEFKSCFFIPASGSGSRMFQFLYDFLNNPNEDNRGQIEKFLNHIEDFAFYSKVPYEVKKSLLNDEISLEDFVRYLLTEKGLSLGDLPKGMVPFHKIGPFILNPFQEQFLQGIQLKDCGARFHFTVKEEFKLKIEESINYIQSVTGKNINVSFSEQNPSTNSFAFNLDQTPKILENGDYLMRPAGHGSLLENLNKIDDDLIFIRNIDNVQHYNKSKDSIDTWKMLGGLALKFREECKKLYDKPSITGLVELNNQYQFLRDSEIEDISLAKLKKILNKPFRICGMVRNEGQPGGGPFWIDDNGVITKQIVEKAQIDLKGDQNRLLAQSSHFNPVMIAAVTKNLDDVKFNLHDFADESKFFIVHKKHKGEDIVFRELPGLWNGSMAFWNTIFIEIPSHTFSPVKTVLDLLESAHNEPENK